MSLFRKVAVCTDIHFGLKSNSLVHNQDCSDFIDWFIVTAQANGCETGMFLGDWSHQRAAITNSFTRILNLEKKSQNIRDDVLEMNGLNPSWTRQNAGRKNPNFGFDVTNIDIAEYNNDA